MYFAAGAERGDVYGLTNAGYARLYAKSGTDWNMIQQIHGTRFDDRFGRSPDFSHDGSMLAIGGMAGALHMYELSNVTSIYELLHTIDDVGSWEVSVSGDGMVVGVTSYLSSIGTRIFERIGDVFQQRGADISGYGYESGIALNYDGSIAIVGDRYWNSDNTGRAAVFQWRDDNEDGSMLWMQMGSDITGDASNDYLGCKGCVSITYDGLTVSVGSLNGGRRGLVRVYNHDSISDTWKQSGIDLVGDDSYDYFSRTRLSSDGTYLAVGAYAGSYRVAYVKVFAKNGDNYIAVRDTIVGEGQEEFGWAIDLSADASALVVGDYSFDGSNDDKGKVYLYDTFSPSSTLAPTASSSPPPSSLESSTQVSSFDFERFRCRRVR